MRRRYRNPPLALIGNPPNPLRFTGPSITFMPFNPFQKWSLDLFGAAIGPDAPEKKRNPDAAFGVNWAYLSLSIAEQAASQGKLKRIGSGPVVLVNADEWLRSYSRQRTGKPPRKDTAKRAYERWKERARFFGLERYDGYDGDIHTKARSWFSMDLFGLLDVIWAILGTPHPTHNFTSPNHAYERELQLLDNACEAAAVHGLRDLASELFSQRVVVNEYYGPNGLDSGEHEIFRDPAGVAARLFAVSGVIEAICKEQEKFRPPPAAGESCAPRWGVDLLRIVSTLGEHGAAESLGIAKSKLNSWVRGHRKPSSEEKKKIRSFVRERKKNRDHKWKKEPEEFEVDLEELEESPNYMKAVEKFRRFHGTDPTFAKVIRIPDGKKEVTRDPLVYVALGHRPKTEYVVEWDSSKKGPLWYHDHAEDAPPLMVLNPETGVVSDIGGAYLVDDWFYS